MINSNLNGNPTTLTSATSRQSNRTSPSKSQKKIPILTSLRTNSGKFRGTIQIADSELKNSKINVFSLTKRRNNSKMNSKSP